MKYYIFHKLALAKACKENMHFCNHIMQWSRFVKLTALPPVMNKVMRGGEKSNVRTTTFSSKQDTFGETIQTDPFHYRQAPHLWKVKFAFLCSDQIYQKSHNGRWLHQHAVEGEKNHDKHFRKGSPWGIRKTTFGQLATCGSNQMETTWVLNTKTSLNSWCYHLTSSHVWFCNFL